MVRLLLSFCIAVLGMATCFATTPLGEAANEADEFSREYSKLGRQDRRAQAWSKRLLMLDERILQAISKPLPPSAGRENGLVSEEGTVVFREFPSNLNQNGRIRFQSPTDKLLIINFRSRSVANGQLLQVVENSLWNDARFEGRIVPSMHVILFDGNGGKRTWRLPDPVPGPVWLRFAESPPCFLGFVETPSHPFPGIAVIFGPSGTGLFSSVCVFSYRKGDDSWQVHTLLDFAGSPVFEYDEKTSIISYRDADGEKVIPFSVADAFSTKEDVP